MTFAMKNMSIKSSAYYLLSVAILGLSLPVAGMYFNNAVLISKARERAETSQLLGLDRRKSIAVLPMADYGDPTVRWFAAGLTDEIATALTRTPDIVTASASATRRAAERGVPMHALASELNVAHVLEGSVRRVDERLRVAVRLVRVEDGVSLWSQVFDENAFDLIAIQERIAVEIAGALETTLDPETLSRMMNTGTRSAEAYEAYLRARTIETAAASPDILMSDVDEAYTHLERARALDPDFAAAHFRAAEYWRVRMAPSRNDLSGWEQEVLDRRREAFRERIDAAITTAEDDVDRKRYRATQALFELRFKDGYKLLKDVAEERPLDMFLWRDYAEWAFTLNQRDDAVRAMRRFANLAWDNPNQLQFLLAPIVHAGFSPLAERIARRLLELTRDSPAALYQAHRVYLWTGDLVRARRLLERLQVEPYEQDLRKMAEARQGCAEGDPGPALALLDDTDDPILQWIALHLLGRRNEAQDLLTPYDHPDGHYQLIDLLVYAPFDAREYPRFYSLLVNQGVEPQLPRPLPYACPSSSLEAL